MASAPTTAPRPTSPSPAGQPALAPASTYTGAQQTDGWGSHGTRQAFENDRRRDRLLSLAGWTVVRFTWRDVEREPDDVTATLARLWSAPSEAAARGAAYKSGPCAAAA